ncbi:MAG: 50S ribosomal protein L4 [Candidatus Kapabacteria bacterium]|nr:50S ribosomal protein L4 [Candidatus Kapabacteria bacterium]
MNVDVFSKDGQVVGQIELPDAIFNIEPHEHAMYLAVRQYLAHQRQGTHKAKERSEVSGGGKKPWRQKGRGTARAGSSRSPLWVGGGTVFGPRPHKYTLKLPKKVARLARKSALTLRLRENNIIVVEDLEFATIKTKHMVNVLKALGLSGEKVLQLLPKPNQNVYLSSRNIEHLTTQLADKISTYDILCNKKLLLHKGAVEAIIQTFAE